MIALFLIGIIAVCALMTAAFTDKVRLSLLRRSMLDIPNERSSHKIPVPRGGGWGILAVLLPVLIMAAAVEVDYLRYLPLLAGVVLLAAVSWIDDRRGLSPLLRLLAHLAAAALGSLSLPADFLGDIAPPLLTRAVIVLAWGWFMNLYNFMDGIDGITSTETIAIALGTMAVIFTEGIPSPFVVALCAALIGCSLGFLKFNWHPARIFLGDIGSVPLGYLTGFCLLTLVGKGFWAAALIIPLYYLADSGITITKRALRGEKIWQAHRQHFYQRAALGLGRHDMVVVAIAIANIGLICAALASLSAPLTGIGMAVLIVALLLYKMHKKAARIHEES